MSEISQEDEEDTKKLQFKIEHLENVLREVTTKLNQQNITNSKTNYIIIISK